MKEQDIEEMMVALRLTEALRTLDASELEALVAKKATGIEKRIAQAKAKKDGRVAAGKRRARLNYQKRWMRAKRLKVLEAIPEKGWWEWMVTSRKQWKIGKQEWEEHVEPCLGEGWIAIHRYDSKKPHTLDNIYIQDEAVTVFDGKEHTLKQLGASL